MASQLSRQNQPAPGPDSQIVAGAWEQPFAIPHQRVTGYRAAELAPISSWRSVGASSNGFFYNAALDFKRQDKGRFSGPIRGKDEKALSPAVESARRETARSAH